MDTTTLFCIVIPLVVIAITIFVNVQSLSTREHALSAARDAYHGSLAKLKAAPNNADLKQRTLDLGRAYANLTREQKRATVYDEMALMHDIGAATAGAGAPAATGAIEEQLKRLDGLKVSGAITDAEHQAQRQKILEGL